MRDLVLLQGLYAEYGSRQWLEIIETLVTTYFGVALGLVGFIVICTILLAVLEGRQKGKPVGAACVHRQKPYTQKRQILETTRFKGLMMESFPSSSS